MVVVSAMNGITDALIETARVAARGEVSCDASVKAMEDRYRELAAPFLGGKILMR
jgi:aspartokinase